MPRPTYNKRDDRGTRWMLNFLDAWLSFFPAWSVAFYAWFFWRIAPYGVVSPLLPPNDPRHISFMCFLLDFSCGLLVFATWVATCLVLQDHLPRGGKRLAWILAATLVPPIGCPAGYFLATRRKPRFSAKMLLIAITVFCLLCGILVITC